MSFRFILLAALLTTLGCSSPQSIQAQPGDATTIGDITKRRDMLVLAEVRQAINSGAYPVAIEGLDQLLENHPRNIDLFFMRAAVKRFQNNFEAAAVDFAKAIELDPDYEPEAYKALAELRQQLGDYEAAIPLYEKYLSLIPADDPEGRELTQDMLDRARLAAALVAKPVPFDPQPLGPNINTPQHQEYFTSISPDGQTMVFTRNLYGENEDFFRSMLQEDGSWGPAEPINAINTDYNEAAQSLSADGRLVVFTSCDTPPGRGSCALYVSEQRNGQWTAPRNMGDRINSRFWESQPSLTADGSALFFTSNRPGGKGGRDIWGSARRANGSWGTPVNMGEVINTYKNDHFPFFHPDGQTLYFTSDGHSGLGANDLFWTRLDTSNVWSTPANLGYPINTTADETNIFVSFDGRTAYYAREEEVTDRRGVNIDLFRFDLPTAARPAAVTYLQAEVVDKVSGLPLVCTVRLRPVTDDRTPKMQTTDEDGRFLLVLPAGKTYALVVDEEGYLFHTEQFELMGGADPDNPFRIKIELEPATSLSSGNAPIVLQNVLYATNSAELLPVSSDELDRLAELLGNRPRMRIELGGHTDDVGGEATNQQLSENRAKSVFDYLVTAGIASDRMTFVGYGESQPVASNDSEEGRAQNRRTEFKVISE